MGLYQPTLWRLLMNQNFAVWTPSDHFDPRNRALVVQLIKIKHGATANPQQTESSLAMMAWSVRVIIDWSATFMAKNVAPCETQG